jgi:hypothetical protein
VISRRLKVGDGEVIIPLRVESQKTDALSAAISINRRLAGLLDCHLVKTKGDEGEDTGMTVHQFLLELGVVNFESEVEEVEVFGNSIQVVGTMPSGVQVKWPSSSS